ncbi:hypothetical protein MYAM1_002271 [Malassezia yamatoensis]|uniref:Uncharacterized protein n=1 Tax=Malassezia yamatoensis TaxID=253288 RepID=A0AAJ5YTJ9_9BASI|nr:hypothetical protein MYAM1_002271 [Malassezia yamatoensis]
MSVMGDALWPNQVGLDNLQKDSVGLKRRGNPDLMTKSSSIRTSTQDLPVSLTDAVLSQNGGAHASVFSRESRLSVSEKDSNPTLSSTTSSRLSRGFASERAGEEPLDGNKSRGSLRYSSVNGADRPRTSSRRMSDSKYATQSVPRPQDENLNRISERDAGTAGSARRGSETRRSSDARRNSLARKESDARRSTHDYPASKPRESSRKLGSTVAEPRSDGQSAPHLRRNPASGAKLERQPINQRYGNGHNRSLSRDAEVSTDDEDEFFDAVPRKDAVPTQTRAVDNASAQKRSENPKKADTARELPRQNKSEKSAPKTDSKTRAAQATSQAVVAPPQKGVEIPSDTHLHHEQAQGRSERVAKLKTSDVMISSEELYKDLDIARQAMHLFMNSRMKEAYNLVADKSEIRLYHAVAFALLSTIKAMMTFEHQDLATAISHCKDALHIASLLRKKSSMVSSFGRFCRGAGPSVNWVGSMTALQQHAELVTAECTLLKAVLSILHSGDLLAVLSEALHLRSAYGTYYSLLKYVEWEEKNGDSASNVTRSDNDFRSGVYLGTGCISLLLGLLPSKVLKIMEVFGYGGDVHKGLSILSRAGRWSNDAKQIEPGESVEQEGVRRVLCDMAILLYHLVVSTFIPVPGVNIPYAEKILNYHLGRYPHGVFVLYFHGRLYSTQSLSSEAIECFQEARDVQEEYVQLKHICDWDMALCSMSLGSWKDTYEYFSVLAEENNWSKAVYTYARASALYQQDNEADWDRASEMFAHVPSLTQKIAGKSIPLEKFVARKARKMIEQGSLTLPAMEFAYMCHCYTTSSYRSLSTVHLPRVEQALKQCSSGHGQEDDLCLAHFLRGVIFRNMAYPEAHVHSDSTKRMPQKQAEREAEQSLRYVAQRGADLKYDHYLAYFAHYELGRLYLSAGRTAEARTTLDVVLHNKSLGDVGRKGKYSMQNMAVLRSNGALEVLNGQPTGS